MSNLLTNPNVRLALRALVAAAITAAVQIHSAGGTIVWHAVVVGAGLAFCEVFTPLNSLVGYFKTAGEKIPAKTSVAPQPLPVVKPEHAHTPHPAPAKSPTP